MPRNTRCMMIKKIHHLYAIQAYLMVLQQSSKMVGEIFNVGSKDMNFSKKHVAEKIRECVPTTEVIETNLEDPDQRNFVINFDKLKRLGFHPSTTLEQGIQELVSLYSWYKPYSTFKTI